MVERELRKEYEDMLLKKKKNYSSALFGKSVEANQRNALEIFRYAFEDLLGWTPQDVEHRINNDILTAMKLDSLIKHIQFPGELSPKTDLYYIAHLLYPKIIKFDAKEKTLTVYKKVVEKKLYRYPKEFWEGREGLFRLKLCIKYMLQNYVVFHDIKEMYECFASNEGIKILKKFQLLSAAEVLYTDPLDALHDTLSKAQRDEFLYHYLKFDREYKKMDV